MKILSLYACTSVLIVCCTAFSNQMISDDIVTFDTTNITKNSTHFYTFNNTNGSTMSISPFETGYASCGQQYSNSNFVAFNQQLSIQWGPMVGLIAFSMFFGYFLYRYTGQSKQMPKHAFDIVFQLVKLFLSMSFFFVMILSMQSYFTPLFIQQTNKPSCSTIPQMPYNPQYASTNFNFFADCRATNITDRYNNVTYKINQWPSTQIPINVSVVQKVIPLMNTRCFPFSPTSFCGSDTSCFEQYIEHPSTDCLFSARSYSGVNYVVRNYSAQYVTYTALFNPQAFIKCDLNFLNCVPATGAVVVYADPTKNGVYKINDILRSSTDSKISKSGFTLADLNAMFFRGFSVTGQSILVQTPFTLLSLPNFCFRAITTAGTITVTNCTKVNVTMTKSRYIISSNVTCQWPYKIKIGDQTISATQTITVTGVSLPLETLDASGNYISPDNFFDDDVIDIDPNTGLVLTQKYPDVKQSVQQWNLSLSIILLIGSVILILLGIIKCLIMRGNNYSKI